MPLDEARDQTVLLRLLDKVAQEGKAGGVLFRGADRLLHGGELAVENARAGELRGDIDEPGAQPGIGVHLLLGECLDRRVGTVELQELALFEVVFEPQSIGAAGGHGDALARLVDLGNAADRRTRGHEIGRLDLAIRSGEIDDRGALRLGADIADVPGALLGIVGDLAGPGIGDEFDRDAEPRGDRGGHVGRDAGRVAVWAFAGHQQEIPHIDRGAQDAGRGQFGDDLRRGLHRHRSGVPVW